MKKQLCIIFAIFITLSLTACSNSKDASSSNPNTQSSSSISAPSQDENNKEDISDKEDIKDMETAVFQLGKDNSTQKTMKVGDEIGEWALSNLDISYDSDKSVNMLEAVFTGEVKLSGTITRSALAENGYDFTVSNEDFSKIPVYTSSERDATSFMLDIPEGITNSPQLKHGETLNCTITVNDYRLNFAYMSAPNFATVVKIDVA